MRVNGWGCSSRGHVHRVVCPGCDAVLDFGESETTTLCFGRVKAHRLRCARCRRPIDLGHTPSESLDFGPREDGIN